MDGEKKGRCKNSIEKKGEKFNENERDDKIFFF